MIKEHSKYDESKKSSSSTTEEVTSRKNSKLVFSPAFTWLLLLITFIIITAIAIFVIPEGSYPLAYVRLILGVVFILFLPGFYLIKMFFPEKLPFKAPSESLDKAERFILSIGMSITIVPLVGILLNYTPWGIRLVPVTLSLVVLTISFAIIAFIRDYQLHLKNQNMTE